MTTTRFACYLRVSTLDQDKGLDSQERTLQEYLTSHGLQAQWYRDRASGGFISRPGFDQLQRDIFAGKVKTVICWKLDRLSRSMRDGINVLTDWLAKDIRVIAVAQQLDFSGPVGQLVAAVLFAIAQMEREALRENTKRGMAAAKARGVKLGKRPKLFSADILPLMEQGMSLSEVARHLNKSRSACYEALRRDGHDPKKR